MQRENEGIRSLLQHSQDTLDSGKSVLHDSGKTSTIVTGGVQDERLNNGRETIIPTLWEGKIYNLQVSEERETAVQFALRSGKTWPSASDLAEAAQINSIAKGFINKQVPAGEQ